MNGFLYVDKPADWTSFDVVNYVRRMVASIEGKKPKHVKVGHTGTLDPAATGLLVLCIGRYTKKVPELIKQDKTYEVEIMLGKTSTTGDKEGDITDVSSMVPNQTDALEVLQSFIGVTEQTPPAFSAIKVNGKRAYDIARSGQEVVLQPRKVTIHSIDSVQYNYPKLSFVTSVGSGTYIRSLAGDIGQKLSTGAYMSDLRRTAIGDVTIDQAYPVSAITEELLKKTLATTE